MSVTAIGARVQEIQQMVGSLTAAPGSADFAATLASATSSNPAAATASAAATATPLTPVAQRGSSTTPYNAEIEAAAAKYQLDPALLKGLIRQESNFDPNAGSPAGARGLTQLMPGTAAALGVTDSTDPLQAIDGGAKYLRQQLDAFGGDVRKALAAYNAGPGAVQKYGGIPPYAETQNYVQKVMAFADGYRTSAPTTSPAAPAATTPTAGVLETSMSPTPTSPEGGLSYSTT